MLISKSSRRLLSKYGVEILALQAIVDHVQPCSPKDEYELNLIPQPLLIHNQWIFQSGF